MRDSPVAETAKSLLVVSCDDASHIPDENSIALI